MADPFSAGGSAVGIISLGITVCHGILAYYGPFRAFQEEIRLVALKTESLSRILRALRGMIVDARLLDASSTAETTKVAVDLILSCQEALCRLERMSNKCSASGRPATSRFLAGRLLYPFRRETLMALVETIGWLQANLNMALQMLQMAMAISRQDQMDLLLSSSVSIAADTGRTVDIATSLDDRMAMLEQRVSQVETGIISHRQRPIVDPALLQSLLATQQTCDEDLGHLVNDAGRRVKCTCARVRRVPYSAHQSGTFHGSGCPFHKMDKKLLSLHARQTFCNRILRFSASVSLEITTGAGGLAISPKLEFHAIVQRDSPAFQLLWDALEDLGLQPDASITIQKTHRKLFELFDERRALPSDTTADGHTILHVMAYWQMFSSEWEACSWLNWRALINDILETGLLPNRINDRGETPIDMIIEYSSNCQCRRRTFDGNDATVQICSDLLSAGGFMTYKAFNRRYHPQHILKGAFMHMFGDQTARLIWLLSDKNDIHDIDFPEELMPFAMRSTHLLSALLRKGTDMRQWVNYHISWPPGLALLLQAGYRSPIRAIKRACEANCESSVKLLTDTQRYYVGPDELRAASCSDNPAIAELIISALVDRRKRLQALAETHLPEMTIAQLNIRPGSILNMQAARACQLLKERSVDVDDVEEQGQWSAYDILAYNHNFDIVDRLWDAGFKDVDEVDRSGMTSLMKLRLSSCDLVYLLEKALWLITKGADINRRNWSSTALHFLGFGAGWSLHWPVVDEKVASKLSQLSEEYIVLLRSILLDSTRDGCSCPCTINGCSGFKRFLDGLVGAWPEKPTKAIIQQLAMIIDALVSSLELESQKAICDELAPGALRYLIFQCLEITHTCTRQEDYVALEDGEISEIHDEQKELIQELEKLLAESLLKYDELSLPLPQFLTEHWWPQMEETLEAPPAPSEDEIRQIGGIGVILDV